MLDVSEIRNASILIVDDQETNVMLLEKMLANAGYLRVSSTCDPRVVCALHQEQNFDLILLDLQMPEMDGFEVIEGLKKIDPDGYLPVLVITAQPAHKLRALQAGAKDFVSKPFDLIEVQTRIHNMLEVRLLYKKLGDANKVLEQTVLERTAELRISEARFKSFTELSSDWYWEQDASGQFTQVSGPVQEMLGLRPDDQSNADGKPVAGHWNSAERDLLHAKMANRQPFLDFIYSRSDARGQMQYLQVSGEPMFDSSCRFTGYRGIGMDVTDRMRPDHEHTRFRSAMDVIDQGIFLVDRTSMRLLDANEAACRQSGYPVGAIPALDLAALDVGSDAHLASIFDLLIAGAASHSQTVALRRKDGSSLAATIAWHAVKVERSWIIVGVIVPS